MNKKAAVLAALVAMPIFMAAQGAGPTGQLTFPAPAVGASSAALHQVFVSYWEWRLAGAPELATQVGRAEYNDRWRDWSTAARARARVAREEFLQQVLYIGTGNLTLSDRLSAHVLEHELRMQLEMEPYQLLVERVSQMDGAHNQVFTVIDQMPARTAGDYENIAARLRALPVYVDQQIELMREQMAAGLAQPAVVVDLMLEQIAAQRRPPAADSPLLAAFRRFPETVPAAEQPRLRGLAVTAYDEQFVPSWTRLEAFLRDTYRPKARPQIAIASVPDGRNVYAWMIRQHTTLPLTAEKIHELGLQEVARIEREMEQIARASGFSGPVTEFERQLGNRPEMRFTSQEEMLGYAREVLARVQPEIPRLFRRQPRMTVGVRPIAADREASTASNYVAGTADGTRQAWFNMNTYRPQSQMKYRTEALVLHETLPGHHLQVGLARELEGVPEFRRVFRATAFSEGWGLYAESLGPELGTVYRDPTTRFGQLASEQFRAVRLVVDTGVHALGWSRDRAREYFTLHVPGQSLAEVDRYIARPGQALAYKVGELKIKELRRKAEQALGARFDIGAFHDAVLRNGTLPLELLEQQVDAYIAAAKAN
jgi:uncharacterized protein (DUF885 family)